MCQCTVTFSSSSVPQAPASGERQGSTDRVYAKLRSLLLSGQIDDGSFLTEAATAKLLGVSRTPIREAFVRLQAEGLLKLVAQRGAVVPTTTAKDIRDIMELRAILEVFAVNKAIEESTLDIESLGEILRLQMDAAKAADFDLFIELDRSFHTEIVKSAQNSVVSGIYQSLGDRQLQMGLRSLAGSAERMNEVVEEHTDLFNALVNKRPEVAVARVRVHIGASLDALQRKPTILLGNV